MTPSINVDLIMYLGGNYWTCKTKNHNTVVVGGHQTSPPPIVPVSLCPGVPVSRCTSVPVSQKGMNKEGRTKRTNRGETNIMHEQGGMNETHKQKLHDLQNPKWPPGGLRMADVAK